MGSLRDAADSYKPKTRTVSLCPDQQLLDEYEDLQSRKRELEARDTGTLADADTSGLRGQMRELQAQIEDAQVDFTVQSLGRARWKALVDDHQPDASKRETYENRGVDLDWDPDTFPPAAIAACLVEPREDTDADTRQAVLDIWNDWDNGETQKLWMAVLDANISQSQIPKWSAGSDGTPSSDENVRLLETAESPGQSSLDEGSLAG